MQVAGQSFAPKPLTITLVTSGGQEVELTVSAYPPGFNERENHLFPEPRLPKDKVRDSRGRVVRDGKVPILEGNENDEKYQNKMLRMVKRRQARRFHSALREDERVTWETSLPEGMELGKETPQDAAAFFDDLFDEAENGGFGLAQMAAVIECAAQLSGMMATEARGDAEAAFRHPSE